MGITLGNMSKGQAKKQAQWMDANTQPGDTRESMAARMQPEGSATEELAPARTAEDFGAVDAADFESFDGATLSSLRNAYSNQRNRVEGEDEGEEEDDSADVRLGEDGGADLAGSRKRKPAGPATSSLSPSIRI